MGFATLSPKPVVSFDTWFFVCLAVIAGTIDNGLLTGWTRIDPTHLAWLHGDPAQFQIGWEFLRHEASWHFPPTWVTRLDYPTGISAAYLDIIPLVAVPLRLVGPVLPQDFQFLGLYSVICYILQAFFGFRLAALFSRGDRLIAVLGGLFFLLSPILTERLYGHFSTSTQWIIVACIYYYFRRPSALSAYMFPFVCLAAISGGISPYLVLFALSFGAVALWRSQLENLGGPYIPDAGAAARKRDPLQTRTFWALALFAGAALSLLFFGFITIGPGTQFAGVGYTYYSMNLLSPINPEGNSFYIKALPFVTGQGYEGYNYLGIGILLLGLIAIARRPCLLANLWSAPFRPLVAFCLIFTVLALSTKITLGSWTLATIPLPRFVFHQLAAFRSSGRLFWPVHYLLVAAAIAGAIATMPSRAAQYLVLTAALILQYFDLLPMRNAVAADAVITYASPLVASDWAAISKTHRHFMIMPALQCNSDLTPGGLDAWPYFARLAARSDMTLNSVYTARISPVINAIDCDAMRDTLLREGPAGDTAYVLNDALATIVAGRPGVRHYCRRVDGFNLCTYDPARAHFSEALAQQLLPVYNWGTEFEASAKPPASMLLENFDMRTGGTAQPPGTYVYIRPAGAVPGKLLLDLEFANADAGAQQPRRQAILRVNGRSVATPDFVANGGSTKLSVSIPAGLIQAGKVNAIAFELAPNKSGRGAADDLQAFRILRLRIAPPS